MMSPQMMQNNLNEEKDYLKFIFKHSDGQKKEIKIRKGEKVKDLLDKYINEIYIIDSKKFYFLNDADKIDKNDQRKVEEVFKNDNSFIIKEIG